MVERSSLRTVALAVVVAAPVVLCFQLAFVTGQPSYTYSIHPDSPTDERPEDGALAYENLSENAREGFLAALESEDRTATVTGYGEAAPDLTYGTDTPEIQYVRYEGSYYALAPNSGSIPFLTGPLLLGGILWAAVAGLALLLRIDLASEARTAWSILAGLAVFVGVAGVGVYQFGFRWAGLTDPLALVVVGGAVFAAPALAVYRVAGRRGSESRTTDVST